MTRKLIILLVMLVAVVILGLPNHNTAGASGAAYGFCELCGQSCWNEANTGENNTAYWQCRDSGHSQSYCDTHVTDSYYNACISVDCNMAGCSLPLH